MKRLASQAAITAMIKAGLKIDKRKAWKILGKLFNEYGIENQQIFNIFLKKVTGRGDDRILAAGVVAYRRIKELHLKTYPRVPSTLSKLRQKGLKLAILTDAPRFQAWTRLFGLKLEKYFDLVVVWEDSKQKKPSKLPFKLAIKKLRIKPENVIMIGDSIYRDVLGAKKLGMITILAKYGQLWKEKSSVKPDFVISKFEDLLNLEVFF
jgi:putative hydrolase of the HAD superfamily